ncbi:monocarboxylate transporter 5-like [Diachasmimorpha longicaudata]|uniref:monocarboxylate transporter 5-like n=1 Tax=Diachasmimorpha longicaudata TaxID=58733 RepID=UPI0030B90A0E
MVEVSSASAEDYVNKQKNRNPEKVRKNVDFGGDDDGKLTLEDLAPDGGWGWMVALAMILVLVTVFGSTPCFAIMFGEFFESTGQGGSVMTLLNSVFMISYSFSGLLTNVLLKKYPMRSIGIVGAVLFSVPNVMLAFVTHVYEMAVISFVQGAGAGFVYTILNANFYAYFVKKRAIVMSAAQVVVGIGSIVYPIWIGRMMETYGFRGTAALVGGMSLNSILGMMLMHPVEWHLRDPQEVREERRQRRAENFSHDSGISDKFNHSMVKDRRCTLGDINLSLETGRWYSLENLRCKESGQHHSSILIETLKEQAERTYSAGEGGHFRPRSKSGSGRPKLPLQQTFSATSASSIGSIAGALADVKQRTEHPPKHISDYHDDKTEQKLEEERDLIAKEKNQNKIQREEFSTLKMLSELLELSLLKDRTFMIMSLGMSFVFVSDFTFSSLLPLAMLEGGYKTADTSMTITVGATAELVSRIILVVFTLFVKARAKTIFFFATIAMAGVKIAYFHLENTLTGILVSTVLIGTVRSWLYVPQPLVIVENHPVEKYAACYGIFSLISGFIMIAGGPLFGFVKDMTGSFKVCQLFLIATNCFLIVPWGMELIRKFWKRDSATKK